jgi:hypothetical protein
MSLYGRYLLLKYSILGFYWHIHHLYNRIDLITLSFHKTGIASFDGAISLLLSCGIGI